MSLLARRLAIPPAAGGQFVPEGTYSSYPANNATDLQWPPGAVEGDLVAVIVGCFAWDSFYSVYTDWTPGAGFTVQALHRPSDTHFVAVATYAPTAADLANQYIGVAHPTGHDGSVGYKSLAVSIPGAALSSVDTPVYNNAAGKVITHTVPAVGAEFPAVVCGMTAYDGNGPNITDVTDVTGTRRAMHGPQSTVAIGLWTLAPGEDGPDFEVAAVTTDPAVESSVIPLRLVAA